jgi:IS4 transposase
VIADQEIIFTEFYASKACPRVLRRIVLYDEEEDRKIVLLTNHMGFAASTIAAISKERCAIETFFETMELHHRIKTFVSTSKNAVMVQLWTALIAMLSL